MGKWTRRDLVKAGLAASAGVLAGGDALGEGRGPEAGVPVPVWAQVAAGEAGGLRERLLLDYGWRFALGHADDPDKDFGFGKLRREGTFAKAGRVDGPAAPRFDDSKWAKIDLPHDWAVDLPFVNDPILVEHGGKALGREFPETSVGWYRREFVLAEGDAGRRISVEFDGIFRNATVFFNGHYIAENMSGYAPLALDLTLQTLADESDAVLQGEASRRLGGIFCDGLTDEAERRRCLTAIKASPEAVAQLREFLPDSPYPLRALQDWILAEL